MNKVDKLINKMSEREIVKPIGMYDEPEILQNGITATNTEIPQSGNTAKKTSIKKKKEDPILTEYVSPNKTVEMEKVTIYLTKDTYKRMQYVLHLWLQRKEKKLPITNLINNALNEYLNKLYKEFMESPPENPFTD